MDLSRLSNSVYTSSPKYREDSAVSWVPIILAAFIGLIYFLLSFQILPLGDDAGFEMSWLAQNDVWYAWPRYAWRHFLWNNGRLADMLTPVLLLKLPIWLLALLNGIITGGLFIMITLCADLLRRDRCMRAVILMTLVALTLRWDAIWMEFCATFNYVWSATFALFVVWLIFKPTRRSCWWYLILIPYCAAAAMMHEACGFPLAMGCLLYSICNRHTVSGFSLGRRLMLLAFIAGGVLTVCAPGAWNRDGMQLQPESITSILFTSGFYVLILTALCLGIVGIMLYEKIGYGLPWRISLFRSPVLIWITATLCSTVFMLASGYGGRPGWFAQIFALITISRILLAQNITDWFHPERALSPYPESHTPSRSRFRIACRNIVIATLSFTISWHYWTVYETQCRLTDEIRDVIALFEKSESGIVYYDATPDHALPWWLLSKTHGVPDADDTYYLARFSEYYTLKTHGISPADPRRELYSDHRLIVLPTQWQNVNPELFEGEMRHTDQYGDIHILSETPFMSSDYSLFATYPRRVADIDGTMCVETLLPTHRRLYYYTTLHEDRGEK